MNKISCFFCYSWDNSDKYDYLTCLKRDVERRSNDLIHVVLDKIDYHYNDNFDRKIEALESYDLIVVFFSPELRSIVECKNDYRVANREVLKEWRKIEDIYADFPERVYPVVLSGTQDSALPLMFTRRNVATLDGFFGWNKKKGKVIIKTESKVDYRHFVNSLIHQAMYNSSIKSPEYKDSVEALNGLFFFTNRTNLPDSCLVRLDIYGRIATQQFYYVIGRKGAGKSTLVDNLRRHFHEDRFDSHYKPVVPLNAESFKHETAYDYLVSRHVSDSSLITTHDLLIVFWEVYITFQCILTIGKELDEYPDAIDKKWRVDIFKRISNKLKIILGLRRNKRDFDSYNRDGVAKSMFVAAVEQVDKQFNAAIDESNNSQLLAPFVSRFTSEFVLYNTFGEDDFKRFLSALVECTRKIIISLDGFDTNTDNFRLATMMIQRDSEEYQRRVDYDIMFFRTLVEVITSLKEQSHITGPMRTIGEQLDFCIVLPRDRYDQIRNNDRDSFKRKFYPLVWDAYELLEILVRRLEYLILKIDSSWKSVDTQNLFRRMDSAISFFSGIPNKVEFKVNGARGYNRVSMSLFNYILRYSFWRPRDVISNLYALLSHVVSVDLDGNLTLNKRTLTNEEVKLIVKCNARELIKQEFYGEYKFVYLNLQKILREFDGGKLLLSFPQFADLMGPVIFETSFTDRRMSIDDKLKILYQLGVLGLYYGLSDARHFQYLHHICYMFNAGMKPLEDFLNSEADRREKTGIILNPMLSSDFLIDFNTTELVGNWEEGYIERLHHMNYIIHSL